MKLPIFLIRNETYPQGKQNNHAGDTHSRIRGMNIGEELADRGEALHTNSQQVLDLGKDHNHRRSGSEGLGHRRRNKADNEAQLEDAHGQFHQAGEEGQDDDHLDWFVGAELQGQNGHQTGGANGNLWYRPEEDIDDGSNEGGVQAVLRGEPSQSGVGDALRNNGESQGDPGNQIRKSSLPVI